MDHNITIGAKLKALRTAKKYTLKQLSEKSGLSIGFLSQLERGISSIAIDSLAKLAEILGVSMSVFFDSASDSEKKYPVSRSFELRCSQVSPQIIQYILTNNIDEFNYLPRIFHLMPFANTDLDELEMYHHYGEEFIYVLEGVLIVYLDGGEYCLNPGDSIQIHSNLPHNWINKTNRIVKILTVNTPNPFVHGDEFVL
ncbi:cupin domain-containing protein [Clostridium sp. D2Q-14]|uniref:helix-turn-helix domain-containing protein n=1 Tax=Anaeromonas gelatinilytica TaxID=2683194 RepID=UPI00193BD065|nr:cupin domain-containing protein [Anaeromonas gelatinilytica]MBS4534069.1 cupin domain-containing protein [Anaeromonas gelatinilytica]